MPWHPGGDHTGNHTSHAKMSAELAKVLNDGLFYMNKTCVWTEKFEPEYSQIQQEVENFKKVNMISQDQFDTLTPELLWILTRRFLLSHLGSNKFLLMPWPTSCLVLLSQLPLPILYQPLSQSLQTTKMPGSPKTLVRHHGFTQW